MRLKTGRRGTAILDEAEAERLGFVPGHDPIVLGCGDNACAYLPHEGSQDVVKMTRDFLDARAAYVFMNQPGGQPSWAIPVRAIFEMPSRVYVLVTALAEPLDDDMVDAFDELFFETADVPDWSGYYEAKSREAQPGSPLRLALDATDEAMRGFAALGLDWSDFHGGNWAMYDGRPVLIDFGMSDPLRRLPVERL